MADMTMAGPTALGKLADPVDRLAEAWARLGSSTWVGGGTWGKQ